jgi:hypothetical protein
MMALPWTPAYALASSCLHFRARADRVAKWHFDPQTSGTHEFGYFHGWRVDYWYTPEYVGYPDQPEHRGMAFFGDGQLRGIFSEGPGNAPLALNKWHASWADTTWRPLSR